MDWKNKGVLSLFRKKKPDETDLLELMKYHIVMAQRDIQKINKESSDLADRRFMDPTWTRTVHGQKEYISDAESWEFTHRIRTVEKRLMGELAPLIEKLQNRA